MINTRLVLELVSKEFCTRIPRIFCNCLKSYWSNGDRSALHLENAYPKGMILHFGSHNQTCDEMHLLRCNATLARQMRTTSTYRPHFGFALSISDVVLTLKARRVIRGIIRPLYSSMGFIEIFSDCSRRRPRRRGRRQEHVCAGDGDGIFVNGFHRVYFRLLQAASSPPENGDKSTLESKKNYFVPP